MTPKQQMVEKAKKNVAETEAYIQSIQSNIVSEKNTLEQQQQVLRIAQRTLLWAESLPDFDPTVEPHPQRGREFI